MQVNNNSTYQATFNILNTNNNSVIKKEPSQPQAPVPPPGGNIENRQPPAKPNVTQQTNNSINPSQNTAKKILDRYA